MASRTALRWRTPWSMRLPLCAFILALLSPALHAVNLADAGLHDWHMPLIGQPSHLQALSPRFHYPAGPSATSVSSLVYTVTQRNVLAAIEPKAGGIAWRHIFPEDRPILKYVLYGDYILVLSGPAASSVDLFSASTGHSIWSLQQHDPKAGLLPEVGSVAADAIFFEDDIITMANGKDVRRISRETGAVLWQWSLEREKDPTLQIHAILPPVSGNDEVDLLLIRRIPGSYSLATTILSASTGSLIADVSTSKSHSSPGLDSVHAAGNGIAVFLDASGVVHTITAASGAAHSLKGSRFGTLVDVHLSRFGIFVGKKEDDTSAIIEIKSDGSVRVLHEWSAPAIQALYTGFIDRNDIAHVTRFYISKALGLASVSTYTVQATTHNEAGQIFGATMPYRPVEHGQVLSLAMEFAPRKSPTPLFRATLVTSSGSFQGWLGGGKQWSREEGLAHLTSDSLVFLPIKEDAAAVSIDLAAIWSRKSKKTRSKTGKDWLAEAFGYRKLIIAATEFGKIHALDLGNGGEIVWTSYTVPQAMAKRVSWKKLALFDKAHGNQTLLMAVAELENEKNTIATAVFYLDAKTGKPYHDKVMGATAVDGPVREILVLLGSSEPTLLFVTPDDLVYVSTAPASISSSEKVTHSIPRVVLTDLEGMSGATVSLTTGQSPVPARFLWQMAMSSGEHVLATAKQTNGKIASVGRVLPDRSTLRKYLNPHLLAIATNRGVYLIDAVTGLLVWNGDQPASSIALSENWLVYSSGHNLVSVELYENSTSSKTYAFPGRVTSLSMSQTEHGVTTTALLVSTTDQIVSISKGALGLPVDPKWVVSHTNRVAGVKGVFSSPTALESTSQILAYGLDLFGSSISPSGRFDVLSRDFNTWQLAGTTSALLGIIGVLKPMVARKKLKERWDRD